MTLPEAHSPRARQAGAVTIMVALMMLVLLTIAAVAMSRNSFREVVNSGFSRQGTMARDVSDSGIEWAMYWITIANAPSAPAGAAQDMVNLKTAILTGGTYSNGVTYDVVSGGVYAPGGAAAVTLPVATATTAAVAQGYTVGMTLMGKLPITGMSQGSGPGAFTPAAGGVTLQAPDLWAIRADAQVVQGNVTFTHGKEAWVSTPVQ